MGGKSSSTNPIIPPELSSLYRSSAGQLQQAQRAAPLADYSSAVAPRQIAPLSENQNMAAGAARSFGNPNPLYSAALQGISGLPGGSGGLSLSDAMAFFNRDQTALPQPSMPQMPEMYLPNISDVIAPRGQRVAPPGGAQPIPTVRGA